LGRSVESLKSSNVIVKKLAKSPSKTEEKAHKKRFPIVLILLRLREKKKKPRARKKKD